MPLFAPVNCVKSVLTNGNGEAIIKRSEKIITKEVATLHKLSTSLMPCVQFLRNQTKC